MEELQKKIDELLRAHEQFKQANDARLAQIEKKGFADPLLEEKVNKANEDISKIQDSLEQIKTAMNRTAQAIETKDREKGDSKEYKKAFTAMLRKGVALPESCIPEEVKTLSVDSNADGGFLVRPELSSRIVEKVFETTPMRQLAAVETISSDSLDIMQDTDEAAAGWVAERGLRAATGTPKVGQSKIFAHEIFAEPVATQKLLDDAAWDVEGWLARKVSSKFARVEAAGFVNGDGQGKPRGFLTYADGDGYGKIQQVKSGDATKLTADGLINLCYSLKEQYQKNCSFLMHRLTVAEVRKLKDSQGRYLWEPSIVMNSPETLLGCPLYKSGDMPTVAAGKLAVACGDWKEGYQIVDRVGIRVLRDPFTVKGSVLFYTTKRVGGDVVNFEAVKVLKIAA